MHILEISKSSSAKTEFSFFSVFFSSVFGFFNTDVGVGFVFLNIAISVSVFGYRLGCSVRLQNGYYRAVCCKSLLTNNIVIFAHP